MKTAELTGAALDWAVAIAEGWKPEKVSDDRGEYWWFFKDSRGMNPKHYHPSTHWGIGGAIIEREGLGIWMYQWNEQGEPENGWYAEDKNGDHVRTGTTPLVAAMRCYVASKLGDEVEIPEELR